MSGTQWIIFFFVIQLLHGLATWKLYVKAGRKAWEAFVPVYNAVVLMKIINRPWWWTILLFLPIVNLILFPVVWVETARSFGKNSSQDTFLAIILLGFYIEIKNELHKKTFYWTALISLSALVHFYFTIILLGMFFLFVLNEHLINLNIK